MPKQSAGFYTPHGEPWFRRAARPTHLRSPRIARGWRPQLPSSDERLDEDIILQEPLVILGGQIIIYGQSYWCLVVDRSDSLTPLTYS